MKTREEVVKMVTSLELRIEDYMLGITGIEKALSAECEWYEAETYLKKKEELEDSMAKLKQELRVLNWVLNEQ